MYINNRKNTGIKRFLIILIIIIILLFTIYKLYKIYNGIEIINFNKVDSMRLSQTVAERKEEDVTVSQMLQSATGSVVGISKLKENGNTIFTENGVSQLGIGSGVIISEGRFHFDK